METKRFVMETMGAHTSKTGESSISYYPDPRTWTYNNTFSFIDYVDNYYTEVTNHHPMTRKDAWQKIANIMENHGMQMNGNNCRKKWENLIRTYKTCREKKNKTGRDPMRFPYYGKMDLILGLKSGIETVHIEEVYTIKDEIDSTEEIYTEIDEATIPPNPIIEVNIPEVEPEPEEEEECPNKRRKTSSDKSENMQIQKAYYDTLREELKKRRIDKKHETEMKRDYMQQKLEIEREKIKLLRELVSCFKGNSNDPM